MPENTQEKTCKSGSAQCQPIVILLITFQQDKTKETSSSKKTRKLNSERSTKTSKLKDDKKVAGQKTKKSLSVAKDDIYYAKVLTEFRKWGDLSDWHYKRQHRRKDDIEAVADLIAKAGIFEGVSQVKEE